ncbi:cystatin-B-like [Hippocampus comes]|uniref:Cystatin-B n=1 Tax=Hippocampus comes TaxID=109280 RepID=A0A3Q2YVZ5_HIPCM|nr:PREDICTED: cystatin-B-like [Hippocampus comes]
MTTVTCPMYGGLSDLADAGAAIRTICERVKHQAEQKAGKAYNLFIAKSYKSQIVSGTNFFIKVHVGGNDYVHIRVFQGLTQSGPELVSIKESKTHDDEIEYF